MPQPPRLISFALLACLAGLVKAQEIPNWTAPPFWSADEKAASKEGYSTHDAEAVEAVPTPPSHFVGLAPCRLVDTRGNGFTGAYGPPSLVQGVPRNFVLAGQCGISPTAQAVSLNVTVTNTQGPGFILIYPQGGAQPTVSTVNYVAGQTIANAAVVPLGTGGGITVIAGVSGANLILDTNGDYRGGVVTALSGLSGNVSLAAGSNVMITPSGQTLTVAATAGPGGQLPIGGTGQTLRHDGSNWVANSALTSNGTNVSLNGILVLPSLAQINTGASKFLHNLGSSSNTYVGAVAGNGTAPGQNNTGVGLGALFGAAAASEDNVAVGRYALLGNTTGDANIALGSQALQSLQSGSGNIGIGINAGSAISTGSNNIYIGSAGFNNESGQIRIGDAAFQNGAVIVGIANSVVAGTNVVVNAGGRLGVAASSRRFKEEIRDLADESSGLMRLRPVTFKYKPEIDPEGRSQYGLIAEEVAEIYPELVVHDDKGRPFTVRYDLVNSLLLNEVQRQHRSIEAQRVEIDELKARLARLETALEANPGPGEEEVPLP